jgi:hypothetical protein
MEKKGGKFDNPFDNKICTAIMIGSHTLPLSRVIMVNFVKFFSRVINIYRKDFQSNIDLRIFVIN